MLTLHIWIRSHHSQLVLEEENGVEEIEGEDEKPKKKWDWGTVDGRGAVARNA